jgi:hypothetical protein
VEKSGISGLFSTGIHIVARLLTGKSSVDTLPVETRKILPSRFTHFDQKKSQTQGFQTFGFRDV